MYPIWEGVFVHSAMFVAIVSSFHVLASHLTVAAGWFNLYLERKAVLQNRPELYAYLRRSALGLLVFAYVFGALSGVGIWQTTTAANPRGISALIHNFVLYWGAEWYMFLIDVVGIIAYYYTFGRIGAKTHLKLAWLLALGGTGTLAVIVGILSFKLYTTNWLETGLSLSAFYSDLFWPHFFLRFSVMFIITAAWSLFVASGMPKDFPERSKIIRYAALFGLAGFVVSLSIFKFWFYPTLPEHAKVILGSPAIPKITFSVIYGGLILSLLGLLFALFAPRLQRPIFTSLAMVVLFASIFGAERTREVMRKPDIVAGYMSSNQLVMSSVPNLGVMREEQGLANGMVNHLPFVFSSDNQSQIDLGRMLAVQQCGSCHSVSSQTWIQLNDTKINLRSLARLLYQRNQTTVQGIDAYIGAIGGFPYMHPFVGNAEERQALATYLASYVQESYPQLNQQAER